MTAIRAITALLCSIPLMQEQAGAATLRVGPDSCPVPAEAEAYIPPADAFADPDADSWVEDSVVIYRDVPLGEKGLFGRLDLDPQSGLPYGVETAPPHCAPADQD